MMKVEGRCWLGGRQVRECCVLKWAQGWSGVHEFTGFGAGISTPIPSTQHGWLSRLCRQGRSSYRLCLTLLSSCNAGIGPQPNPQAVKAEP
jgi:hypothetical protein